MQHWGKLMNDELAAIAGRYEDLVGRLQERYGLAKEETRGQVDNFRKTVEQLKRSNARLILLQKRLHDKGKTARKPVRRAAPSRKRMRVKSRR